MEGLTVNVRSNTQSIVLDLMQAGRDMRDKATVSALNKLANQVKTAASKEVRAAGYNLKAARIKDALRITRATQGSLRAVVTASGKPIQLIEYDAKQTSAGVTVKVMGSRKLIKGGFIAMMPSGHKGVFVKKPGSKHKKVNKGGKASWHQLGIQQLWGPSIPNALANTKVRDALQALIVEKFPGILEHEHAWLAKRLGR